MNLRIVRHIFDGLAAIAALAAIWLALFSGRSFLFLDDITVSGDAITALESALTGTLGSISGMLIASFLISSQVSGHRPYSRLTACFRGVKAWYPFVYLLLSVAASVAILIVLPRLGPSELAYVDASVVLAGGTVFALVSLMLNSFSVFSARSAGDAALRIYTRRAVREYRLLDVGTHGDGTIAFYHLRGWGHRHNLADPLGPYHDLLMETVADRQRITMHLYLSCLMRRVAYLNGVLFRRSFGRKEIGDFTEDYRQLLTSLAWVRRPFAGSASIRLQVLAHALHYVVRRSERLIKEWELDNHRQIFTIMLADLIMSLRQRRDTSLMINVCVDAILRINLDYKYVPRHGSYEPTHELFKVAVLLDRSAHYEARNRLIAALAWLDNETNIVSKSTLTAWPDTVSRLPANLMASFAKAGKDGAGKSFEQIFPTTLWPAQQVLPGAVPQP